MKRKEGINLQQALDLYDKNMTLTYKSSNWLDGLEREKGYEVYYASHKNPIREEIKALFKNEYGDEKITYINYYETNWTSIRGLYCEVIVLKIEYLEG